MKAYDKAYSTVGSTLRAEVTVQDPELFKVFRRPEGKPDEPQQWYRLRHGVADLHRRAEMQRPVIRQQKRCRALHPFGEPDVSLPAAISRGDFSSIASEIGTCNNCSTPSLRKVGRSIAGVPPRSAARSACCAPCYHVTDFVAAREDSPR